MVSYLKKKEKKKARSRRYPAETMKDEFHLHSLEQAVGNIVLDVNGNKTVCFG